MSTSKTPASKKTISAYCYPTGPIYFGHHTPDGAIEIASGPQQAVHLLIASTSDVMYPRIGSAKYFIPGTLRQQPESPAITEQDRFKAVQEYCSKLASMRRVGILIAGTVAEGEVISTSLF